LAADPAGGVAYNDRVCRWPNTRNELGLAGHFARAFRQHDVNVEGPAAGLGARTGSDIQSWERRIRIAILMQDAFLLA